MWESEFVDCTNTINNQVVQRYIFPLNNMSNICMSDKAINPVITNNRIRIIGMKFISHKIVMFAINNKYTSQF